ncbi:11621_t:CDS:10, partial [Funneliformis caledonium]
NDNKWTKYLLEANNERRKYSRPDRTIFIWENANFLRILPQHSTLPNKTNMNNTNNVYLLLKLAGIENDFNNKVFVPLIPSYCVYTKLGKTYFRLDLEWCNKENTILYKWNDFANDYTFTNLREFISQHIPSFFQLERTLFRADCQHDNILKQAKRKVKELQEYLYFEDTHNKGIIREGLPIVADGWQGSNEIVQALDTVYRLKIQKENESDFLSTNIFLELILNQSCITCHDINPSNCKTKIRTIGLRICITKKCMLCSDEPKYYNERSEDDFSKCLAGAGLVGGINREELQFMLALLGIIRQNGHQQYFDKQEEFFSSLYQVANISVEDALVTASSQASEEIIFNEELEGYGHRPVLAYHVVEKKCEYETKDGKRVTIQEGNYDSSSQQMEYIILIAIIEKISTILEKYNIKLNVSVDGDLSTNKTLALLNVVNQIFADLKHKAKIMQSKIASDRNWKHLEQSIMKYYTRCIYAASVRANNSEIPTLTDKELAWIHTKGVICHLQGNHTKCWSEVCWIVNNSDLSLPTPNLVSTDDNQYWWEKSLIYAVASILLQRLTVIFTPQKALMDDQVREMVGMEIPAAMLYAFSKQSPLIQEKIFAEIASRLYEAHCIVSYEGFRNAWKKLGTLKCDFLMIPVLALTATCSPVNVEIIQSILKRPNMKVIRTSIIYHNLEEHAIIYGATVIECNDMMKKLQKNFDPAIIEMYHGKFTSKEQSIISANWKNKIIKIMSTTSAFGMGINVNDVTLIIHTTLSMSYDRYIQEIGQAGRSGQQSRAILFYSQSDICTLLTILSNGQESITTFI